MKRRGDFPSDLPLMFGGERKISTVLTFLSAVSLGNIFWGLRFIKRFSESSSCRQIINNQISVKEPYKISSGPRLDIH